MPNRDGEFLSLFGCIYQMTQAPVLITIINLKYEMNGILITSSETAVNLLEKMAKPKTENDRKRQMYVGIRLNLGKKWQL